MFCKLSPLEFTKLANFTPPLLLCRSVFTFKISLDQGRLFRVDLPKGGISDLFNYLRLLADSSILVRNSHIRIFTLFPLSPLSALRCALVVTGSYGAY